MVNWDGSQFIDGESMFNQRSILMVTEYCAPMGKNTNSSAPFVLGSDDQQRWIMRNTTLTG